MFLLDLEGMSHGMSHAFNSKFLLHHNLLSKEEMCQFCWLCLYYQKWEQQLNLIFCLFHRQFCMAMLISPSFMIIPYNSIFSVYCTGLWRMCPSTKVVMPVLKICKYCMLVSIYSQCISSSTQTHILKFCLKKAHTARHWMLLSCCLGHLKMFV